MHSAALFNFIALLSLLSFNLVDAQVQQRVIDCIADNTHESCNNLCYSIYCLGLPTTLTHNSLVKSKNRRLSGAKYQPFAKTEKYNVQAWNQTAVIADEYPYASCSEGGLGAVLRGTTAADSQSQSVQVARLWRGIPNGGQIEIVVGRWDPVRSPYCNCRPPANTYQCCASDGFEYTRTGFGRGKLAIFDVSKRDDVTPVGMAARAAAAMVEARQDATAAAAALAAEKAGADMSFESAYIGE